MRSVKRLVAAGAASLLSSVAVAADMAIMPSPMYAPPPIEDFGGWYLRGDIGMSNQRVASLFNVLYNSPGTGVQQTGLGFDSAGIAGIGVGYQILPWLRADVTTEWRGKANFHGLD